MLTFGASCRAVPENFEIIIDINIVGILSSHLRPFYQRHALDAIAF